MMRASHVVTIWILSLASIGLLAGCSDDTLPGDSSILCGDDTECPYGQYCEDGVCKTTSVPCDEQDSCPEGSVCRNGVCVTEGDDGGTDGDGGDGGDAGEPDPEPDITVIDPPQTGDPPLFQLNFGNVAVGSTVEERIVLRNDGEVNLQIIQLNFEAGSDADDFSVPDEVMSALPIVVPPGEETSIDVIYLATDGRTDHAILDIISNDPDEALVQIHLLSEFKGDAFAAVSPQSLDFGEVAVGQESQPLSFLVSNQGTGNAALLVEGVRFGVLANPDFGLTVLDSDMQEVVPPVYINNGDFLQISVVYHPQAREDDADEVVVVTDDPTHLTLEVAITGRGVLGNLAINPTPVDLGKVRIDTHEEITVTLSNEGGAPFSITGVALADTGAEWTLTSLDLDLADLVNNPRELQPDESVTVTIGFDPVDVGIETGSLVVDNTTEEPQRIAALSAEGFIPPAVETTPDPPVLLFGNVQLDFGSGLKEAVSMDVLIKNVGGEPLVISGIQRAVMTSPEYTFEPASIPPIDLDIEVPLQVTFEPMDLGSESGSILIDTNDPDIELDGVPGRFRIEVLANGIDPNIFVDPPASHNFGDVYVGRQVMQDIQIRNAGTGPLELTGITLNTGSSPDYELHGLPALPMVISNTSMVVTFQVSYTPDILGPDSGAILIECSDIGTPEVTILVDGTGAGCPNGAIDCDGDPQNGCERPCVPNGPELCNYLDDDCDCDTDEDYELQTDPENCGTCGTICQFPYGVPACVDGDCELLRCLEGHDDCNDFTPDGCETNTGSDDENCGSCDNVCQFDNADASCLAGQCVMGVCDTGFRDCDASDTNGCEADIFFDENNCGNCNLRCLFDNGVGICSGGNCFLDSCLPEYANCDGVNSNGCEVHLMSDPDNCNFCNNICPDDTGTPFCNDGVCEVSSCNPGLADCDGQPGNGCEVNIWMDPNNCGGCGIVCNLDHASSSCSNGSCIVEDCDPGYGDCDQQDPNGCETDTTSDPNNCDDCGDVCNFDNGTGICQNSTCVLQSCDPDFHDIDLNPANGCECQEDSIADNCIDNEIFDLGALPNGASRQLTGNLIPAGTDQDWYTFTASDNNTADVNNGYDNYHVHVYFDAVDGNPLDQYYITVYRNPNTSALCADKGSPVCGGEYIEYDHYYYNECSTGGNNVCRQTPTGPGPCICVNNTARYWFVVKRSGSTVSCDPYIINIDFTQ
jgi:hypothetical protein